MIKGEVKVYEEKYEPNYGQQYWEENGGNYSSRPYVRNFGTQAELDAAILDAKEKGFLIGVKVKRKASSTMQGHISGYATNTKEGFFESSNYYVPIRVTWNHSKVGPSSILYAVHELELDLNDS